jgi:hypothetical protein
VTASCALLGLEMQEGWADQLDGAADHVEMALMAHTDKYPPEWM